MVEIPNRNVIMYIKIRLDPLLELAEGPEPFS